MLAGRPRVHRVVLAGAALAGLAASGDAVPPARSAAQSRSGASTPRRPPGYVQALQDLAAALGAKHRVTILVDPGVAVPAKPAAPPKDATIEKALDGLVAPLAGVSWRRVYIQRAAGAALPEPWRLAEWVRGLDRLARVGMVVEDAARSSATVLMRDYQITKGYRDDLARAQYRAVYIIYSTVGGRSRADATDPAPAQGAAAMPEVLGDMLAAFFALDEDSQREGMGQAMALLWSLDAPSRADFVRQMWTSMTPEMQKEMVRVVAGAGVPPE